jgi:hypothetical protein
MQRLLIYIMGVWMLNACNPKVSKTDYPGLDFHSISHKIMEQAQVQPGERVLMVIKPGRFDSLALELKTHIEEAGAMYLGIVSVDSVQPQSWSTDFTNKLRLTAKDSLVNFLSSVDLGIMLPGATPADDVYAALQQVLNQGKGRAVHFHWEGAYSINGDALKVDSKIDSFYQHALLKTDYSALSQKQQQFENAMRSSWVEVSTPSGTNLKFQIGDRPVTKQDGNASMAHMASAKNLIDREVELPSGAIRVAPIEESVEGTIAFPDAMWNKVKAEKVILTFVKGKVTEVNAAMNKDSVVAELNAGGDAAYSFREFALGFNPLLQVPADNKWIPYYGYGAGVVRLSLGDNSELGGNVKGNYVRWNFFTNATVKVNGEVWVLEGVMIK